jgi:hypothetical protein
MNKALAYSILSLCLLLPFGTSAAPNDGTSPSEVITRLLANASKNPLGPVENDVTDQTVQTVNAMAKDPKFKDMMGSVRESIAGEYNQFNLEAPLTSLYLEGSAAIFYGKAKLTTDGLANQKENSSTSTGNPPGFGEGGGFSDFIGPKVKDDGHVVATFCLVQQHGLWKVHGVYLSNDVIEGSYKAFIIRQLTAFAKKS